MKLEGLRAIVTGGSRGIGYEIAKIFLEEGAEVLAVSRDERKLAEARALLPPLRLMAVDVSSAVCVDELAKWVEREWGILDVLVNNAGVSFGSIPDLTTGEDEAFDITLATNVRAAYLCTKRLLPSLLKSTAPRVLNVGSRSGLFTANLQSAYGVSKAALHALTIATANELAGRVAVNALSPGWVLTDMAPDAPRHPRWSAKGALSIVTKPLSVTGQIFHGRRRISWSSGIGIHS